MWLRLLRLWSSPRTVLRSVLALDDTSHAIALGAAIGMLVGMTPTVGMQTFMVMAVALFTSRLFYFNRAAALLMIYISNPLTVVPIYYGLYWVGTRFLPGTASVDQFRDILTFEGFGGWWQAVRELVFHVGLPLCIGTLIIAPLCGILTYPLTLAMLRWFGRHDDGYGPNGSRRSPGQQSADSVDSRAVALPTPHRESRSTPGHDTGIAEGPARHDKPALTR